MRFIACTNVLYARVHIIDNLLCVSFMLTCLLLSFCLFLQTADVLLRHVAYSQEEAAGILDSIKLLEMTPGWPVGFIQVYPLVSVFAMHIEMSLAKVVCSLCTTVDDHGSNGNGIYQIPWQIWLLYRCNNNLLSPCC